MCGIVGLFSKSPETGAQLGHHLGAMLAQMAERGPDSAGVAIYRDPVAAGQTKLCLHSEDPHYHWGVAVRRAARRARLRGRAGGARQPRAARRRRRRRDAPSAGCSSTIPQLRVMSAGESIEIYKEKGDPADFVVRFGLDELAGTHALGHTRMATESRVTTEHSHPFSTGPRPLPRPQRLALQPQRACGASCAATASASAPTTTRRSRPATSPGGCAGGATIEEALEGCLSRARRLLHLRGRHARRLRRAARPVRLQARGPRRDRRLGRDGLRVPGDRGAARRRRRRASGSRRPAEIYSWRRETALVA